MFAIRVLESASTLLMGRGLPAAPKRGEGGM
jgi:hypothetical protein